MKKVNFHKCNENANICLMHAFLARTHPHPHTHRTTFMQNNRKQIQDNNVYDIKLAPMFAHCLDCALRCVPYGHAWCLWHEIHKDKREEMYDYKVANRKWEKLINVS